jgi:hypothetical protein
MEGLVLQKYKMHNSRIIIIRVRKVKLSLSSHEGT